MHTGLIPSGAQILLAVASCMTTDSSMDTTVKPSGRLPSRRLVLF